ncbi:hypothetical protein HGRIS_009526 [Hohenbuehelia grisea]|uniref:RRM domain-containing protein n=1 Tax=Hohenbuehelia grisea TaxID=104357 RepID=A0ABR3J1J9_9AGAR
MAFFNRFDPLGMDTSSTSSATSTPAPKVLTSLQTRTLFILKLAPHVTAGNLRSLLGPENITRIELKAKTRNGHRGKHFCPKIVFKGIAQTERAFAIHNGHIILGTQPPETLCLSVNAEGTIVDSAVAYPRWIKTLPTMYTAHQLYDALRPFGPILSVMPYPHQGGYVQFRNEDDALAAGKAALIDGKSIVLKAFEPNRLFCVNLPMAMNDSDLRSIFANYGEVSDTSILQNKNGTSRRCGFVAFKNDADAYIAVKAGDVAWPSGWRLHVEFALPRKDVGPRRRINHKHTPVSHLFTNSLGRHTKPAIHRIKPTWDKIAVKSVPKNDPETHTCHLPEDQEKEGSPPVSGSESDTEQECATPQEPQDVFGGEGLESPVKGPCADCDSMAVSLEKLDREFEAVTKELNTVTLEHGVVAQELESVTQQRDAVTRKLTEATQERDKANQQRAARENEFAEITRQRAQAQVEAAELLQSQINLVAHLRDELQESRRQLELSQSRCKILALEADRLRSDPPSHLKPERGQGAGEESASKAKVREAAVKASRRRMEELRAEDERRKQEKQRKAQEEKLKQEQAQRDRERLEEKRKAKEEAKRKKREEEERQQEARRRVEEEQRRRSWEKATIDEDQRCRDRDDIQWGDIYPWDSDAAIARFKFLCNSFDETKFTTSRPLTFRAVPWPMLADPFYNTYVLENVDWATVETFFRTVKLKTGPTVEFKNLVQRVHRMFHPDRWRSRGILETVFDPELRLSLEKAGNMVAQAMTPIWMESRKYS